MELIKNVLENKKDVEKSIKRHGFMPEHNFCYYINEETPVTKNIFFRFEKDTGILAQRTNSDIWYSLTEVLAPKKKRLGLYLKFLDYAFKNNAKKVNAEFTDEFKDILSNDKRFSKKYRILPNETLYWPVFEMKKWDGHKLEGKEWKKMRNIINRLKNKNKIEIRDAGEFSKQELDNIIKEWVKKRKCPDKAHPYSYYNSIKNNFEGYDFARVLSVNNKPCAITAGWKYGKNKYYSEMGILNYKYEGLGELSNWDDLVFLKKKGFSMVDFGGSDKALLKFKMKFRPHHIYKTNIFYIHKK